MKGSVKGCPREDEYYLNNAELPRLGEEFIVYHSDEEIENCEVVEVCHQLYVDHPTKFDSLEYLVYAEREDPKFD